MSGTLIEDEPEKEEGAEAPKKGKKKLIIIVAAALVVLGGGGGAAFMFMGGGSDHGEAAGEDHAEAEEEHGEEGEEVAGAELLVDVPPMVVNIRTPGGEPRYLKLRFMMVASNMEAVEEVKGQVPAVIDAFQPFLRELRPEDLAGSAAVYRVKEELLARCTDVLGGGKVSDILIQDLLQQ